MPILDTERQRAAGLILALGLALLLALWPFSTGLVGAPVLYVVMAPLHRWLARRMPVRAAAAIVVVLGILLVVGPGVSLVGLVATEAQDMATGVVRSADQGDPTCRQQEIPDPVITERRDGSATLLQVEVRDRPRALVRGHPPSRDSVAVPSSTPLRR